MPSRPRNYNQPNVARRTGPGRVYASRFNGGEFIHRRGGKFVTFVGGGYYRLAVAADTSLAGVALTEQYPHPAANQTLTTTGVLIPVDFGLEVSAVIPTTGRLATEDDIGSVFDLITVGSAAAQTLRQFINMNSTSNPVLRISELVDRGGSYVAAVIPNSVRGGNL